MKLPQEFVDAGLELAKGATCFGVSLEDLTRDELIAVAAKGYKGYVDQLESSVRHSEFMRTLKNYNHN